MTTLDSMKPQDFHQLECGCTFEGDGLRWLPCPAHAFSQLHKVRKAHAEVVSDVVVNLAATRDGDDGRLLVAHGCNLCGKDCGGCASPAYQCAWLLSHTH